MPLPRPTDPLGEIYAEWSVEFEAHPQMSLQLMRWVFEDWQRATTEPEEVGYATTSLGGVPGILVTPAGADPSRMMVVMHGGGFALGSASSHRKLAGHLARACGARAFVVDFRLAPEFPFPAQIEDGLAVHQALLDQGIRAEDICFVGDSAGGNLAIAMTLTLRRDGRPLPGRVLTMSPWLNMENTGATIETNNDTDFLITREGLAGNIDRYLSGGADPRDPYVNPLYATYEGFPPLYVCAADTESLFEDSERLVALARSAGTDVTFSVGRGMQHVFPFQAGRLDRADEEIAAMAVWYRS
ncbi:alpha/beta hydrolase [Streptomyces sp. SHP 1-2]|uniref:alpha/beta hydrolase n=1 Tax=Streptomyces sp. SHP 1-2 TaxID=2769489 RepID=UPI0022386FCF|nr:alpha/beta hydrolase [Streptomyces sp. SHP 1-2]MCW5251385.1 alpha/beta hydrolase [Streptomyces sp. SHP 1-2]